MISKNFTKYFQIPLYWLTLLVFFFLVSSLIPMLTGYFVSLLTSGTDKHEVFRIFGPNFPRLMSFLSSLAFSIALSLFLWSKILCPIGSISLAAKQVADGDFSVHVPNSKSLQAICELTDNFNRMVQELNSIESLRNDFVTTVSHEFKTPLAAIEGYATLLQDPSLSEADRNEYTRIIIDSTRQLTTMTGNILLLSRLEKQEIVTGRTMFSLDEQIRQAILLLEPLWEKKHLNLDIDLTACKFYGNCEMRVSIRDTGVGMDDATMKRIFEKFYSRNSDPNEKGNGLGLSITKRIIDLMHGTIEVSSQVDEGSCFTVILPLEKA